ncbi:hypothetical protein GCM10023144_30340 [Pigmentiphaga soli]|uniref:Uncharacterized protein n=1 Tax=Pigmentiphaga soli TaxID=1007095 RepID=A0ABP8H9E7_9BURK
MQREGASYVLHHIAIPTSRQLPGQRYAAKAGMYTSDDLACGKPTRTVKAFLRVSLIRVLYIKIQC